MNARSIAAQKGFSLMELMIVLAVLAVLVVAALPTYEGFVQRSKRNDAMSSLLRVQLLQEKWRGDNTTYAALGSIWSGSASQEGFYNLAITSNTASTYRVTATPTGAQASDSCGTFALNQDGPDYSGSYADQDCWGR